MVFQDMVVRTALLVLIHSNQDIEIQPDFPVLIFLFLLKNMKCRYRQQDSSTVRRAACLVIPQLRNLTQPQSMSHLCCNGLSLLPPQLQLLWLYEHCLQLPPFLNPTLHSPTLPSPLLPPPPPSVSRRHS